MALASYKPTQATHTLGNENIVLRGLNLEDMKILITTNLSEFEIIFSAFVKFLEKGDDSAVLLAEMQRIGLTLIDSAPGFCASAIAQAAVEDSTFEDRLTAARSITGPAQIMLMKAVAKLSFEEVGGVKKFFEQIAGLMTMVKKEDPPPLTLPSRQLKKKKPT